MNIITSIKDKVSSRAAAGAVGVAMTLALIGGAFPAQAQSLTSAQVSAIVSLLQSFGANSATISNVQAALTGGTTTTTTTTTSSGGVCPFTWTRTLTKGSTGADVMALQQFLNMNSATMVASSGAGSPGMESTYYGALTAAAVSKFQVEYAAQILTPEGLTAGTGTVGPATRTELNALCTSSTTTTTTGSTTTTSNNGTLMVAAATQPVNAVVPASAARVPFTTFTLTNSSSAAVTVNSVTAQRTGIGLDTDFSGVVLLDSSGNQIGNSAVFNSLHQVTIGTSGFTLQPGQSMTYTVAGNIAPMASLGSGDVNSMEVVAVNTTGTVSGSLPISGASMTMNNTLAIGSVTVSSSSYDPNGATTKAIGTTGYRFSGLRFTAGSSEDVTLKSIRWNQSGSAGTSDIGNVVTVVNGTSYPTTVDSTGKYYTTIFPSGIVIPKGQSVDVYVQADLVGGSSAGRTVEFDIYKNTDIYFVGNTYGFGISVTSTGAGSSSFSTDQTNGSTDIDTGTNPYFLGSKLTITAGSVSTIQNATTVAAQNVAVNVPNQPLGGFQTSILGEPLTVQGMTFKVNYGAGVAASSYLLQNVSLVDQNGTVVAGPVNGSQVSGDSGTQQTLNFTGSISIPVGTDVFTLEGQLPSGVTNNTTVSASTTPSTWTGVTGQTTGNTISLSALSSPITMNQMTVKGATTTISMSSTPVSQTIVSGGTDVVMANIQVDASQSGENVRFSSLPLTLTTGGTNPSVSNLSGCQLYNGATALTTGSNVVNPSGSSPYSKNFTLDNSLTVPKGTVTTLALECNISSGATGQYTWSLNTTNFTSGLVSGVQSGSSVTPSSGNVNGPTLTLSGSGTLVATTDASSPSYTLVAGGTTGVTIGAINFQTANEAVNLQQVALTLTSGLPSDVSQVYLYNGATQVGTLSFTGTSHTATSTLASVVNLPANAQTVLTIKADIGAVGTNQPAMTSDLVQINLADAQGYGASSGKSIYSTGVTAVAGARIFKTYPTVAIGPTPASNPNGTNQVLKKFSITANSTGPVGLAQLTFNIATSSAAVSNVQLFGYTDSGYSQPISNQGSGGLIATPTLGYNGVSSVAYATTTVASTPVEIPAGQTYYFTLTGTVTLVGSPTNWTVATTLLGDSTFATSSVSALQAKDYSMIWSDNATTTTGLTGSDWTTGYGVAGLPSTGL